MFATSEGRTINVGVDFVDAVTMREGYKVELHAMPGFDFRVSLAVALNADAAQLAAFLVARREGKRLASDAATIQRF